MITPEYIAAFELFVTEESRLVTQQRGEESGNRVRQYFTDMYNYLKDQSGEFVDLGSSGVTLLESEFAERSQQIREKLFTLTDESAIPRHGIFIPSIKLDGNFKNHIIHRRVATLVRQLYDFNSDDHFSTLRQFKPVDRVGDICKWLNTKNGKNFLYEYQVSEGLRKEVLIRKRLQLFDKGFAWTQMAYMSQMIWIHQVIWDAYEKWKLNNSLWSNIDHLRRQLRAKEVHDESRLEINFMRLLEENGYKGRFIHDESVSWQLKFRPDFWFVKEGLIVEYDERAHNSTKEDDAKREKIIKRHVPNVHFIRIKEGFEPEGLRDIKEYLDKFEKLMNQ